MEVTIPMEIQSDIFGFNIRKPEAYDGVISFAQYSPNLNHLHTIQVSEVENPQTIHFILKVTDKGSPALSRYKRVVVTIEP